MNLNVENLVRSAVVLAVGLPLTLAATGTLNSINNAVKAEPDAGTAAIDDLKASLKVPCIKYSFSKNDSKLEREAKNDIDDALGGEVSHTNICKWVF